jgi:mitochondrial import inner membrane translocase subunit TIM22
MAYDTPYATATNAAGQKTSVPLSSLPLRKQLASGFRDMGTRSWSTAKGFGTIGALFAGIECGIEGFRGRNDMANGVAAGCLTGGILARASGPSGMAVGCAGFAAFSAAIDAWMRMPKDE